MKNYKKILLLTLVMAIASLAISSVNAATVTPNIPEMVKTNFDDVKVESKEKSVRIYRTNVKFKEDKNFPVHKYLGKGEHISTFYYRGYSPQTDKNRLVLITISDIKNPEKDSNYKMIDARIKFTKTFNSRTITGFRTLKVDKWGVINRQAPKGWNPQSATVRYRLA